MIGAKYADIVHRYVAGHYETAVADLGKWAKADITRNLGLVNDAYRQIRKCSYCLDAQVYRRFPLRAAILLHADRDLFEQIERAPGTPEPSCGLGPHALLMERLAAILMLLDPESHAFVKQVYVAMARHSQWSLCVVAAQQWSRRGLVVFPQDVSLLMALGLAAEAEAFRTVSAATDPDDEAERLAAHRSLWENAGQAFENVTALDPGHAEAQLRLGRVLWRLRRFDASLPRFEAAAKSDNSDLQYLAHLFRGRSLEEKGSFAAAEEQYRAALTLQPLSEVAAVALSYIRFLSGDSDSARDILAAGLVAVQKRTAPDPWATFEITPTPDGELILADLRRGLRR